MSVLLFFHRRLEAPGGLGALDAALALEVFEEAAAGKNLEQALGIGSSFAARRWTSALGNVSLNSGMQSMPFLRTRVVAKRRPPTETSTILLPKLKALRAERTISFVSGLASTPPGKLSEAATVAIMPVAP